MKWVYKIGVFLASLLSLCFIRPYSITAKATSAQSILEGNNYISYSPNGSAFTVGYKDIGAEKHSYEYLDYMHLRFGNLGDIPLEEGCHYYKGLYKGAVPVGYWKLCHPMAQCIHSNISFNIAMYELNNMGAVISNCGRYYNPGWIPYCAYCGERIVGVLFYISEQMASTLDYLPSGVPGAGYFYLCPYDNSLENTSDINHICNLQSFNKYQVIFNSNIEGCGGAMPVDEFIYNNQDVYEGEIIAPQIKLSKCSFYKTGYIFKGWSLSPGGEVDFQDEELWLDIQNRVNAVAMDDNSIINLYGVWVPVKSNLVVDYCGGNVNGNNGPLYITGDYGESIFLEEPVFADYTIGLDPNGGYFTEPGAEIIKARRIFTQWSKSAQFFGRLNGNEYSFISDVSGSKDYISAKSTVETVDLPVPRKDGYAFDGWVNSGGQLICPEGESYTPVGDIQLYAKWVEVSLALTTEPNYSDQANQGRGAANLEWIGENLDPKTTYRVYRCNEDEPYEVVGETEEDLNQDGEELEFSEDIVYIIQSDGMYEIELSGASGENYENNSGGKGGLTEVKLWLTKGAKLEFIIGKEGAGGEGHGYANGGGASYLYITDTAGNRSLAAVAGGGGGASSLGDGGEGGSSLEVLGIGESSNGDEEQVIDEGSQITSAYSSGGGEGYFPGRPGKIVYERHVHEIANLECGYHVHSGNSSNGGGCYSIKHSSSTPRTYTISCYSSGGTASYTCGNVGCGRIGTITGYSQYGWYDGGWHNTGWSGYLNCPRCGNDGGRRHSGGQTSGTHTEYKTVTTYSLGCGKNDGFNCSALLPTTDTLNYDKSSIAGGGSNWVCETVQEGWQTISSRYDTPACMGVNEGNGNAKLRFVITDCVSETNMWGVPATDTKAPETISEYNVRAVNGKTVNVTWRKPDDNGSRYSFYVESYSINTGELSATSNISRQLITTGIAGYLVMENNASSAVITRENGIFVEKSELNLIIEPDETRYLHIAAVDRAGNISEAISILLDSNSSDMAMLWDLRTESLSIDNGSNILQIAEREYYIKADGKTPFYLEMSAVMDGKPRESYQIDEGIFEEDDGLHNTSVRGRNIPTAINRFELGMADISIRADSGNKLIKYPFTKMVKQEGGKRILLKQGFVVSDKKDGEKVLVVPRAGATESTIAGGRILSDRSQDVNNAVTLIFDGAGPVISGAQEFVTNNWLIDKENQEKPRLVISVDDFGCGVNTDDFYITMENSDNACKFAWRSSGTTVIDVALDEDTLEKIFYMGNFKMVIHASDKVGNVTEQEINGNGFDMVTNVTRMLEEIDGKTVFARGESGILEINTFGYADYVEVIFPEELSNYNAVFNYDKCQEYLKNEKIQFMIPLYAHQIGDWEFDITVIAHKKDSIIESHPKISVVEVNGTVLDELRTTLR